MYIDLIYYIYENYEYILTNSIIKKLISFMVRIKKINNADEENEMFVNFGVMEYLIELLIVLRIKISLIDGVLLLQKEKEI